MKWEQLKYNTHLSDFTEFKESVISNSIKKIPENKKIKSNSKQQWFGRW